MNSEVVFQRSLTITTWTVATHWYTVSTALVDEKLEVNETDEKRGNRLFTKYLGRPTTGVLTSSTFSLRFDMATLSSMIQQKQSNF